MKKIKLLSITHELFLKETKEVRNENGSVSVKDLDSPAKGTDIVHPYRTTIVLEKVLDEKTKTIEKITANSISQIHPKMKGDVMTNEADILEECVSQNDSFIRSIFDIPEEIEYSIEK